MEQQTFINELKSTKEFFERSTRCLTEEHASFAPTKDSMTTCQQVAHVAQTLDWFLEGAFGAGFDMNFEAHMDDVVKIKTMAEAKEWLDTSFEKAIETATNTSFEDLAVPVPTDSPVFGGMPRYAIFPSIVEHTAHHRGALTVYSRLLGLTPAMPYMDMPEEEPQAAAQSEPESKAETV